MNTIENKLAYWLPLLTFNDENISSVDEKNYEKCIDELDKIEKQFSDVYNQKKTAWAYFKWHILTLDRFDSFGLPRFNEFHDNPIAPTITQVRRAWSSDYDGILLNKYPVLLDTGEINLINFKRQID